MVVVRTKQCLSPEWAGHLSEVEQAVRRALRRRAPALTLGALSLLGAASTLPAWGADATAAADTNSSSSSKADDQLSEVVITGQRKALDSAQHIKENADEIVDSIVAADIGKLP